MKKQLRRRLSSRRSDFPIMATRLGFSSRGGLPVGTEAFHARTLARCVSRSESDCRHPGPSLPVSGGDGAKSAV
eukprot:758833-Hanusia_phi.AAC.1